MALLEEIKDAAKEYAEAARLTKEINISMDKDMALIEAKYSEIKTKAEADEERSKQRIYDLLSRSEAKALFKKPRTQEFYGVTVGFRAGQKKAEFDQDATIKLIKAIMPERIDFLLSEKTSVVKSALKNLTPAELRDIGVIITGGEDETVVSYK